MSNLQLQNQRKVIIEVRRIKTQKVDRRAIFKSGFAYKCHFCDQKRLIKGYVLGLLDTYDMINMTKVITADSEFISNIDTLKEIYDHLSREFVHFGTKAIPDKQPDPISFENKRETVLLWGLEGVVFCLKKLNPLTNYYFRKFKLEHK